MPLQPLKTENIIFRATPEFRAAICAAAERRGVLVSDLIRQELGRVVDEVSDEAAGDNREAA